MKTTEIRFQDVLWALKKHFAWICLATLIFTIGAWLYTKYAITPMYRASLSFCIFASERQGEVSNNELISDNKLSNTVKYLLNSQPVTTAVSNVLAEGDGEKEGINISPDAISSMISATVTGDTQIISVYVTSSSPQLACDVAEAIVKVAPAEVLRLVEAGKITVVNKPSVPTTPYTPDVANNVTGGFILGLLLACAVVIAIAMLDTTIWQEEDLERSFNIPVLGTVPSITNSPSNSYRSYEYRR